MSMFQSAIGVAFIRSYPLKYLFIGLVTAFWFASEIPSANAVVCARGFNHAGCAGPRGAAVVRRPPIRCYWRNGVRICR